MARTAGTRRLYGLDFPVDIPDHQVELMCWKRWREEPFCHGNLLSPRHEHLLRACRMLFTKQQLTIHPWFETMARSWTDDEFAIWWGCAGSGKSHSLGLFTLLDYIESPNETFALLASTSKEMLVKRSFASVLFYLQCLKSNRQFEIPFKAVAQPLSIVPEGVDEAGLTSVKGTILGVAVQQGTEAQATTNLRGVHLPYTRLILDELSAMRPAAMATRTNMAQCKDLKVMGASNPESFYDQCGIYSEPAEGWGSVNPDVYEWKSVYGKVYRFDALQSPGLLLPQEYPYLPNKVTNNRIITQNRGNEDAPEVWTMLRAWPPAQTNDLAMISEADLKNHAAGEGPESWKQIIAHVGGFDPAYSSGGDNAVFVVAEVGIDTRNLVTIHFTNKYYLEVKASADRTVMEQLLAQLDPIILRHNLDLKNVGVDDSGVQSMADVIEMKYKRKVHRVQFSGTPPELPVSTDYDILASDRFKDTATWLWSQLIEYVHYDQVRGLPADAAQQLCRRRFKRKVRPIQMESKMDMKKRTKQGSPDEADACAIAISVVRMILNIMPGATSWAPQGVVFRPTASTGGLSDAMMTKYNNMESTYSSANVDKGLDNSRESM